LGFVEVEQGFAGRWDGGSFFVGVGVVQGREIWVAFGMTGEHGVPDTAWLQF
jgi:hypothetical protein